MYLIKFFFSFVFYCYWCARVSRASSGANEPPPDFEVQEIQQKSTLKNCKIKIRTYALYICEDMTLVFKRDESSKKFTQKIYEIDNVIDADIDGADVVAIGHDFLTFIIGQTGQERGKVDQENPILIRIKVLAHYTRLIILSRPEIDRLELPVNNTDPAANEYIIHSFLLGGASHIHHIKFIPPDENVELDDSSFQEIYLYNDDIFGHDYLFVLLKQGKVYIYKSLFEDPEFDFYQKLGLPKGSVILDSAFEENYLFLLIQTQDGTLRLEILKINPTKETLLQNECTIELTSYVDTSKTRRAPQIQTKTRYGIIYVFVNFPGSSFLTYSFQKPSIGIYKTYCPTPDSLIKNSYQLNDQDTSYDFDYDLYTTVQNIILTPKVPGKTSSYLIPFCLPNYSLADKRNCVACQDGYKSQGGFQSSCSPCSFDSEHVFDKDATNTLNKTCPSKCKDEKTFGENCLKCDQYLSSIGAKLPENSSPVINQEGQCSFKCKGGAKLHEPSGSCITDQGLVNATENKCSQLKDCMNCSFSPSCSWCGGSCHPVHMCYSNKNDKKGLLNDYFRPALACGPYPACGPKNYHAAKGNFSFATDDVYKNQLCGWYVEPNFQAAKNMTLTLHYSGSDGKQLDNPPNLFLGYCLIDFFLKSCHIAPLGLKPGQPFNLVASNIQLFAWVEEDLVGTAKGYQIEYEMYIDSSFFENIFRLLEFVVRILSVCVLFSCLANSFQRYALFSRRRRLMRELEGLELIGFVDNNPEEIEQPVNVEEIMQDNRIISRVTFNRNINEFEQTECPICLESFDNEENLAKLQCKHMFHINCLHDWIQAVNARQQIKCPVCNRVLL